MDNRIVISTDDLTKSLNIWLSVANQKRPALLRDLWTRKGDAYDAERIQHARRELARYLAEKFAVSDWQVTRDAIALDKVCHGDDWIGTGGRP